MSAAKAKCQICGRKQGRRQDGTIKSHYVKGDLCAGVGHQPFELECDAIDAQIEKLKAEQKRWMAWSEKYWKGNRPPAEAEFARQSFVFWELERLEKRRLRWEKRDWKECHYRADGKMERFPPTPEEAAQFRAYYTMAAA